MTTSCFLPRPPQRLENTGYPMASASARNTRVSDHHMITGKRYACAWHQGFLRRPWLPCIDGWPAASKNQAMLFKARECIFRDRNHNMDGWLMRAAAWQRQNADRCVGSCPLVVAPPRVDCDSRFRKRGPGSCRHINCVDAMDNAMSAGGAQ